MAFIASDQGGAVGHTDALNEQIGFARHFLQFLFQPLAVSLMTVGHVQPVIEHFTLKRLQQIGFGGDVFEDGFKFPFNRLPPHGLAIEFAAFGLTKVVRVFLVLALRPAGFQRNTATIAADKATQRKIQMDVPAHRHLGPAMQLILNFLKRIVIDQPVVLAFG